MPYRQDTLDNQYGSSSGGDGGGSRSDGNSSSGGDGNSSGPDDSRSNGNDSEEEEHAAAAGSGQHDDARLPVHGGAPSTIPRCRPTDNRPRAPDARGGGGGGGHLTSPKPRCARERLPPAGPPSVRSERPLAPGTGRGSGSTAVDMHAQSVELPARRPRGRPRKAAAAGAAVVTGAAATAIATAATSAAAARPDGSRTGKTRRLQVQAATLRARGVLQDTAGAFDTRYGKILSGSDGYVVHVTSAMRGEGGVFAALASPQELTLRASSGTSWQVGLRSYNSTMERLVHMKPVLRCLGVAAGGVIQFEPDPTDPRVFNVTGWRIVEEGRLVQLQPQLPDADAAPDPGVMEVEEPPQATDPYHGPGCDGDTCSSGSSSSGDDSGDEEDADDEAGMEWGTAAQRGVAADTTAAEDLPGAAEAGPSVPGLRDAAGAFSSLYGKVLKKSDGQELAVPSSMRTGGGVFAALFARGEPVDLTMRAEGGGPWKVGLRKYDSGICRVQCRLTRVPAMLRHLGLTAGDVILFAPEPDDELAFTATGWRFAEGGRLVQLHPEPQATVATDGPGPTEGEPLTRAGAVVTPGEPAALTVAAAVKAEAEDDEGGLDVTVGAADVTVGESGFSTDGDGISGGGGRGSDDDEGGAEWDDDDGRPPQQPQPRCRADEAAAPLVQEGTFDPQRGKILTRSDGKSVGITIPMRTGGGAFTALFARGEPVDLTMRAEGGGPWKVGLRVYEYEYNAQCRFSGMSPVLRYLGLEAGDVIQFAPDPIDPRVFHVTGGRLTKDGRLVRLTPVGYPEGRRRTPHAAAKRDRERAWGGGGDDGDGGGASGDEDVPLAVRIPRIRSDGVNADGGALPATGVGSAAAGDHAAARTAAAPARGTATILPRQPSAGPTSLAPGQAVVKEEPGATQAGGSGGAGAGIGPVVGLHGLGGAVSGGAGGHHAGSSGWCPVNSAGVGVDVPPALGAVDGAGACGSGAAAAADAPLPVLPASSISHPHGYVPPAKGPPPTHPGELRLCGLTFHPVLCDAVRRVMDVWLECFRAQRAAANPQAAANPLSRTDPAKQQMAVLGIDPPFAFPAAAANGAAAAGGPVGVVAAAAATFRQHGLSSNIICNRLASMLGLKGEHGNSAAPLPESCPAWPSETLPQWAPKEGDLVPCDDPARGGRGLKATREFGASVPLSVMSGYVMPAAERGELLSFGACDPRVRQQLSERAGGADTTDVWRFLTEAFSMPFVWGPDAHEQPQTQEALGPAGAAAAPKQGDAYWRSWAESVRCLPEASLCMLGFGGLGALVNDPRVQPRAWVEGNDVKRRYDDDPATATIKRPNCMVLPICVRGLVLLVLVSIRGIKAGEQLLRDYGAEWWHHLADSWELLDAEGCKVEGLLGLGTEEEEAEQNARNADALASDSAAATTMPASATTDLGGGGGTTVLGAAPLAKRTGVAAQAPASLSARAACAGGWGRGGGGSEDGRGSNGALGVGARATPTPSASHVRQHSPALAPVLPPTPGPNGGGGGVVERDAAAAGAPGPGPARHVWDRQRGGSRAGDSKRYQDRSRSRSWDGRRGGGRDLEPERGRWNRDGDPQDVDEEQDRRWGKGNRDRSRDRSRSRSRGRMRRRSRSRSRGRDRRWSRSRERDGRGRGPEWRRDRDFPDRGRSPHQDRPGFDRRPHRLQDRPCRERRRSAPSKERRQRDQPGAAGPLPGAGGGGCAVAHDGPENGTAAAAGGAALLPQQQPKREHGSGGGQRDPELPPQRGGGPSVAVEPVFERAGEPAGYGSAAAMGLGESGTAASLRPPTAATDAAVGIAAAAAGSAAWDPVAVQAGFGPRAPHSQAGRVQQTTWRDFVPYNFQLDSEGLEWDGGRDGCDSGGGGS